MNDTTNTELSKAETKRLKVINEAIDHLGNTSTYIEAGLAHARDVHLEAHPFKVDGENYKVSIEAENSTEHPWGYKGNAWDMTSRIVEFLMEHHGGTSTNERFWGEPSTIVHVWEHASSFDITLKDGTSYTVNIRENIGR